MAENVAFGFSEISPKTLTFPGKKLSKKIKLMKFKTKKVELFFFVIDAVKF